MWAAALLWVKKPWFGWALAAVLAVGAFGLWHHKVYSEGIAAQKSRDQKQYQLQLLKAQQQTADAQKRAQQAETNYAREQIASQDYRKSHPFTDAKLLCADAPIRLSVAMPAASASESGDVDSQPAATGLGQAVHASDPPIAESRLRLLEAAATLFDEQTALIREYMATRGPSK